MIVDDEPLAVERLQLLCDQVEGLELVGTAHDGVSALRMAEGLHPQLLLVDINMPRMDGIGLAKALAAQGKPPAIIFVTAYDRFAVEAFDLAAVDYLLKPVALDRLQRAITRLRERLPALDEAAITAPNGAGAMSDPDSGSGDWAREFWVPHRSELKRIDVGRIDRIEAERDYMRLHVGTRSYLLHETIKVLESRLNPTQFVRTHRSHIIRKDYIKGLRHEGGGVWLTLLDDGTELRIGRTYLTQVKKLAGR
ncbi:LytR/AlgR family response regulator transcription factor [Alterisphingorhabdus coralli]|uniref:LytTR family DNA-binding domain-containing protein n=1 Tax=Alterisphingorhabdus coralli TaxID=3071408 RepID=A0AA97I212_9SPHN|nr:LytTR family DNA-binding domain-containing protein [Parasphingorhabdus sp. SCSIO 66989]WOE75305.1 LytTR family DNA-binding domain-containing protein [Parasphingorhabdus sp. SCSIO 66989]